MFIFSILLYYLIFLTDFITLLYNNLPIILYFYQAIIFFSLKKVNHKYYTYNRVKGGGGRKYELLTISTYMRSCKSSL